MFGIVVNEQGFKVEFVVLNEDKSPQFYTLKNGESIIEKDWQIANGMNKPQWNGSEWIDIEPLPPQEEVVQEPSKMEVRLGQIEDAVGVLATQVAKNTLLQNGGMK